MLGIDKPKESAYWGDTGGISFSTTGTNTMAGSPWGIRVLIGIVGPVSNDWGNFEANATIKFSDSKLKMTVQNRICLGPIP